MLDKSVVDSATLKPRSQENTLCLLRFFFHGTSIWHQLQSVRLNWAINYCGLPLALQWFVLLYGIKDVISTRVTFSLKTCMHFWFMQLDNSVAFDLDRLMKTRNTRRKLENQLQRLHMRSFWLVLISMRYCQDLSLFF